MVSSVNGIDLSIIIPVFNGEEYIERVVNSICQESTSAIEIIIVDDGSTDRTFDLCQMLAFNRNNILVLSQPNGGVSNARNHGLRRAKGEYIWFVDADDYVKPNIISYLINIAQESKLDLLQFGFNIISSKNNVTRSLVVRGSKILPFSKFLNEGYFKGVLWQSFIKRSCIGDAVFCDNIRLGEDGLFFMSIFNNIKIAKRIDLKVYNYCQNDLSVTHNIPFEVCLRVFDEISLITYPDFSRDYVDEFIAFFASLSIYSNGYNQQQLIEFLKEQSIHINDHFFLKSVQNAFAYNYGLLKEKMSLVIRVEILKRIQLINLELTKSASLSAQIIRFAFRILPLPVLDYMFCFFSIFVRFFFLKR